MAHSTGQASWNLGSDQKPELTPEVIEARTQEITGRFSDLFIAFGLAVTLLADEGDPLGLWCLSTIVKQLLADGADRCGDIVDKARILE